MSKTLFLCLLTIASFLTAGVSAQSELDPTFGTGGKANISFGALATTDDIAIQADNKIVIVTECSTLTIMNVPFCAVRVNENGVTDSTFRGNNPNSGGGVFTWFDTTHAGKVNGVAIQADGKVIAVGYGPGLIAAMVRYNTDGSLDGTFGTGGVIFTDVTVGANDSAEKVAVQADGKIVVVGSSGTAQYVARYLPGGTLDSSFGTDGVAKTIITNNTIQGRSLAIQPDGKIVAGGVENDSIYSVTRLNANGSPDVTWDGDGLKLIPFNLPNFSFTVYAGIGVRSIGVLPDGRVIAVGHNNIVFCLTPDGSLDMGFDGDGSRPVFEGSNRETYRMALSPAGKIWVVGGTTPGIGPYQYLIARVNPDGSPDTTFGTGGNVAVTFQSFNSTAIAAATDPNGRLVVAGLSGISFGPVPYTNATVSAARFLAPVSAVGLAGRVTRADGLPVVNAILTTNAGGGTFLQARTNQFGYYSFPSVMTGQNYTISVNARGLTILDRTVFLSGQLANFDFTAEP